MQNKIRLPLILLWSLIILLRSAYSLDVLTPTENTPSILNRDPRHTIKIALSGKHTFLNPAACETTADDIIQSHLLLRLFSYDQYNQLVPDLVDQYTISDDGKLYTFVLKNIVWNDGTPVSSEDVVSSFQMLFKTKPRAIGLLGLIKNGDQILAGELDVSELGITALSARTFSIELDAPLAYFLKTLAHCITAPLPKHLIAKYGISIPQELFPVNGPFKINQLKTDQLIFDKNFKFYQSEQVKINRVIFLMNRLHQAAISDFELNKVHILENPPAYLKSFIEKRFKTNLNIRIVPSIYYLVFNMKDKLFKSDALREAMNLSINRKTLVDELTQGFWIATDRFIPNFSEFTTSEYSYSEDNLVKAKALMTELGYNEENKLKITVSYNSNSLHQKILEGVARQWEQIYIVTQFEDKSIEPYYKSLQDSLFQVARASWKADVPDPQNFLFLFDDKYSVYNYGHYNSLAFTDLLDQASVAPLGVDRLNLLKLTEDQLLKDNAVIPLLFYGNAELVGSQVIGYRKNAPLSARRLSIKP